MSEDEDRLDLKERLKNLGIWLTKIGTELRILAIADNIINADVWINGILDDVDRLQNERDEAREAARSLSDGLGGDRLYRATKRWPWLEEE